MFLIGYLALTELSRHAGLVDSVTIPTTSHCDRQHPTRHNTPHGRTVYRPSLCTAFVVTLWSQTHPTHQITFGHFRSTCGVLTPRFARVYGRIRILRHERSPGRHKFKSPLRHRTSGFDAWGLLVFGALRTTKYGEADETPARGCMGQRFCLCSLRLTSTSFLRVCRGASCMNAKNAMAVST